MPGVAERLVVSSPPVCAKVWSTSDAVIVLESSMPQSIAAATGHPIAASFEPGADWFYDYEKQLERSKAWNCFRRIRIPKVSPYLDRREECRPIGNRS